MIGGAVVACACVVLPGVGARVLARAKGEGASLRMYGRCVVVAHGDIRGQGL